MTAADFDDPFPVREGQRAAMQLQERMRAERDQDLARLLERVARNQQSMDDVRRLAVELGIRLTLRTSTHTQD